MVNFSNVAVIRPSSKVVQVPGGSSSRTRGGGGFKDIAAYFDTIQDDIENKRLLKEVGLPPNIVDDMDSATLTAATQQVGINRVNIINQRQKDIAERHKTTLLNNLLGKDVVKTVEGMTEAADITFRGFSPSEDKASKKILRIQNRMMDAGLDLGQIIESTTPKPDIQQLWEASGREDLSTNVNVGQSLANFMKGQAFRDHTPTEQELAEGFEGRTPRDIPGGFDRVQDREIIGEDSFNHVQGLMSHTTNTFKDDLAGLARYMNSDNFKTQMTQAQARDRDAVNEKVAIQAAETTQREQIFKSSLDAARKEKEQLNAEKIQQRKEARGEKIQQRKEGRVVKTEIKSSFDEKLGRNVYKRFDSQANGDTIITDLGENAAVNQLALDFGLQELTKTVRESQMKKTSERLILSGNEITRLKNIGQAFDKDFVTSKGRLKGKVFAVWDSIFGLSVKTKAGKFLAAQTKFRKQTHRAFTEFKVRMTGMAAAVLELADLRSSFLNEESDGATVFLSSLKDMLRLAEDMDKIDLAYLKALEDKVRPSDAIKIRQNQARKLLTAHGIEFTADEALEQSQVPVNPNLKRLQNIYNINPGAKP